ncbi:MAG: hypothetical protein WBV27_09240 [Trichococcus sp.]
MPERQTVDDITVALPGEIRQAATHPYFRNTQKNTRITGIKER